MNATRMRVGAVGALCFLAVGAIATVGQAGATEASASCALPQGSERVRLDPSEFTTKIDNPWWPMKPGGAGCTARRLPTGLLIASS